jgi:hypothetical protein
LVRRPIRFAQSCFGNESELDERSEKNVKDDDSLNLERGNAYAYDVYS